MSTVRARPAARPAAPGARAAAAGRAPEVIVVTHDPTLERSLREASPATPMRVATTPAALADLLMTGRAGALVLDVGALDAAAITVARHLAEQFPDVPLVAVGSREDEARLAGLISAGLVYRFLHRPVSTARARTFIDAALRRAGEIGSGARPSVARAPVTAAPASRHLLALAAAGAAATAGLALWLALRPPAAMPPAGRAPAVASGSVDTAPAATAVAGAAPAVVPGVAEQAPTPAPPALPATPAHEPAADANPPVSDPHAPVPAGNAVSAPPAAPGPVAAPAEAASPAVPPADTVDEAGVAAPAVPAGVGPDPAPVPPGADAG
jgi:DNA-binding NarL/FixJ family response regulator